MKTKTYVDANGHEIEKMMKPYGWTPKKEKKFKKGKKVRHTVREL